MEERKKKKEIKIKPTEDEANPSRGRRAPAEAGESSEAASGGITEELDGEALIEKIRGETEELNEKYLRLLAEFDNYKKRTARQFEEITRLANERIITTLLDVLDNFSRALDAGMNSQDADGLLKGVELIYSHFQDILKREGLTEIETQLKPFDPRYHEAVQHLTTDELDPDMIVEEIQKGYMLGDKVIRPSRVVVSRRPDAAEEVKKQDGN